MNMIIVSQVIVIIGIVLLGIICFKYDKFEFKTKSIALAPMLVGLSLVLSFFSIMLPMFGFPALKIGFGQLPLMVLGVVLGPSWAFISGIVADFLGFVITPTSFPYFGFTLNSILAGVIPGFIVKFSHKISPKVTFLTILTLLVFLFGWGTFAIWMTDVIVVSKVEYVISDVTKIAMSVMFLLMAGLFIWMTIFFQNKYKDSTSKYTIASWMLCALLVELIINIMLTPIWLDIMYGIPFAISSVTRIAKACVMVFLNIGIGYALLKIINRFSFGE